MRKVSVISFLFLAFRFSYSQKYQPIDSTIVWRTTYTDYSYGWPQCCYIQESASYQFHGFVINNGNTWFKLYKSAIYGWTPCQYQCTGNLLSNYTNQFVGYILNDTINKKIYGASTLTVNYIPTINDAIYDFYNKNIGDSIWWKPIGNSPPPGNLKFKILSIDSFQFTGKYHKVYSVQNSTVFLSQRIINVMEGMGSSLGPFNSVFSDFESNSALNCFSKPQQAVSVSNYTNFVTTAVPYCATINAVPELESSIFSVYPNPVSNQIIFENRPIDLVHIVDVFGKIVIEKKENTNKMDVQQLSPGVYFINIISENKRYISKFIKE